MLSIILIIIAFGILILIHEGGHFIFAKLFGVYVEKFSIGFGPPLFHFKIKETDFRVSLIPLGGYVKMKGENPDEQTTDSDAFYSKKWWQKALIAFAGPFANFVFALLLFYFVFIIGQPIESLPPIVGKVTENISQIKTGDKIVMVNDKNVRCWDDIIKYTKNNKENTYLLLRDNREVFISNNLKKEDWTEKILPKTLPIIGSVSPGMPAYLSGLKEKDKILTVNGEKVNDWYQLRDKILHSKTDTVTLEILRNGKKLTKKVNLQENILNGNKIIGITQYLPVKYVEKYNPIEALYYSATSTIGYTALNYVALFKIFLHPSKIKENIGGPVMLYAISKKTAKKGFRDMLLLFASINILLMVMNLLPIPVLDGGNIFFFIVEGIRKKPLSLNVQLAFQKVGLSILLVLTIVAFSSDIFKLTKRHFSEMKDSLSTPIKHLKTK